MLAGSSWQTDVLTCRAQKEATLLPQALYSSTNFIFELLICSEKSAWKPFSRMKTSKQEQGLSLHHEAVQTLLDSQPTVPKAGGMQRK